MDRSHPGFRAVAASGAYRSMAANLVQCAVGKPGVMSFRFECMSKRVKYQPPVDRDVSVDDAVNFLTSLLSPLSNAVLLETREELCPAQRNKRVAIVDESKVYQLSMDGNEPD